ncbi:hypothetical protein R4575_18035 [Acinetobacter baumannii]|nr:hypothetical protein [Acinetobacter baumannii]
MSNIKKYERDDLIYLFGQIPGHILFVLVWGIMFLSGENQLFSWLNPFNWLLIGVFSLLTIIDIYHIFSILIKVSRENLGLWNYINTNLYQHKSQYSFLSLNNAKTSGMGLALFGFLIFPDPNVLLNNPVFGQTLTTIMAVFGVICAAISLILSRYIYKDYLKELSISKGN